MIIICFVIVSSLTAVNLTYDKVLRNLRGIRSYENQDFEEARRNFEENVINHPGEGALHLNLGNSHFREGNLDAALTEYLRALRDEDFTDRSNAYQNIGNALFEQQKYKEALESFRNAVITDPENEDARYNYELTRLMLQEMSEETQQQPLSGDGDDEEEEEQQQQEQRADAQPDDSEGEEEAEVTQREEGEGDQPQESDPDRERELQEAEDILRTLMARERELLEEEREKQREAQKLRGKFW
jgi:tetratricopeptide (TPR) repeat protein